MILIHPVVTHKFSTFSALCAATGMRARLGERYWRLVPASELPGPSNPPKATTKAPQLTPTANGFGGDAA